MKQSNAFGLAGLLAVVVMLVLMFWLTSVALFPRGGKPGPDGVPGTPQASPMDRAHAVKCLANLKVISMGVMVYKVDNNDRTPVMRRQPASDADVNAVPTGANATNADYGDTGWVELGDQGMQNVWLMIQSGDLKENVFHCPGDAGLDPRDVRERYGWTSPNQFSYAIQWPYKWSADERRNEAPFVATMNRSMATFADRNPGVPDRDPMPSNHPAAGTNALVGDSPTELDKSRVPLGGGMFDSIYTNDAGEPGGMPLNRTDISMTLAPRADESD